MSGIDPCSEFAGIDSELRKLLEQDPSLADGYEEEVEDLNQVIYLPRAPTDEEWERALKMGVRGDGP